MSEKKGYTLKVLEEEPVIAKKYAGKKTTTESIIVEFLETGAEYAEINLRDSKARGVARALGRVINARYKDKVKYLGRDDEKNVVYLKKIKA